MASANWWHCPVCGADWESDDSDFIGAEVVACPQCGANITYNFASTVGGTDPATFDCPVCGKHPVYDRFNYYPVRLEIITNVGPSDGTFDPDITTSMINTLHGDYGDGNESDNYASYHRFSHSYATEGPHTAIFSGVMLGLITQIDVYNDKITAINNLSQLPNLKLLSAYANSDYTVVIEDLPMTIEYIAASHAVGSIDHLAGASNLYYIWCSGEGITGSIESLSGKPIQQYKVYISSVVGQLESIISSTLTYVDAGWCPGLTLDDASEAVNIQKLYVNGNGWDQARVDRILDSIWQSRANYTYSAPELMIGTSTMGHTQAEPTGTYAAPSEGANWHEDTPGHWVPLTGYAKYWDLVHDVNSEGFHKWTKING